MLLLHTHTHTFGFPCFMGTFHRQWSFILYKLYTVFYSLTVYTLTENFLRFYNVNKNCTFTLYL